MGLAKLVTTPFQKVVAEPAGWVLKKMGALFSSEAAEKAAQRAAGDDLLAKMLSNVVPDAADKLARKTPLADQSLRTLATGIRENVATYGGKALKYGAGATAGGVVIGTAYELGQAHPDKPESKPWFTDKNGDPLEFSNKGAGIFAAIAALITAIVAPFVFGATAAGTAIAATVALIFGAVGGGYFGGQVAEDLQKKGSAITTPTATTKPAAQPQAAATKEEHVQIEVPKNIPNMASASGGKQNPAGQSIG